MADYNTSWDNETARPAKLNVVSLFRETAVGNLPASGFETGAEFLVENDGIYVNTGNKTTCTWTRKLKQGGDVSEDSQFAPLKKSDGVTSYTSTDSEFTTPSSCSASSESGSGGSPTNQIIDNAGTTDGSYILRGGPNQFGERITDTSFRNKSISAFKVYLRKYGSPTGTITAYIRKWSDWSIIATSTNTVSMASVATTRTEYTFNFSGATSPNEDFVLSVESSGYSGSPPSDFIGATHNASNPYSGGTLVHSGGTEVTGDDLRSSFDWANLPNTAANAKDGNLATRWESNSEIGPWIKIDMNTAQELLGIAIYAHINTTASSFKIETDENDDTNYRRRKTVPYTLITNGAWNIIFFPRPAVQARRIKLTGLDGSAKVFAITDIKVFIMTESVINRRHRHILNFDPTVNCLTLTGA